MTQNRKSSQIAKDRQTIARLYLQGQMTQVEIGEQMGMSQQMVSYDLAALRKLWIADARMDFDEAKARQLAKIDEAERAAWAGWLRSCETAEKSLAAKIESQAGSSSKAEVRKEGRDGNPRFLEVVLKCVEQRSRLCGLNAPIGVEHSGAVKIGTLDEWLAQRNSGT